jgi:hypothetical protein
MAFHPEDIKPEFTFGRDGSDQEGLSRGAQYTAIVEEDAASLSHLDFKNPGHTKCRKWQGSGGIYRVTSHGGNQSAPFIMGTSRFILNKDVPDTTACHIPADDASAMAGSCDDTAIPRQQNGGSTSATVGDSSQRTIIPPK